MRCKICLLFVLVNFAACGDNQTRNVDSSPTDASIDANHDQEILSHYNDDVDAYQMKAGMPPEWADWMKEKKDWWSKAYINGRGSHEVHVYITYDRQIQYDPPWVSEAQHFAALKRMADLQYPGWNFIFSAYQPGMTELHGNDVVAMLGYDGVSHADGKTIYLVWEGIFAHEFGHTIGLHHHYCGNTGGDGCPEQDPPGEGLCIMDRTSVSFGPTENSFLLQTTGDRWDDEINQLIRDINNRYPDGYGLTGSTWDDCAMDQ